MNLAKHGISQHTDRELGVYVCVYVCVCVCVCVYIYIYIYINIYGAI